MSFIFWNVITERSILNNSLSDTNNSNSSRSPNFLLYLIPVVCLFGIITNGLNISVFLNSKMKDISFTYMLAISASNLLYNVVLVYAFYIYCEDCDLYRSYGTQVFKIIVNNYLASCLAIFSNLVEIYLSLQRNFILKNKKFQQLISPKLVLIVISIISYVFYIPALFCYDIVANEEIYTTNHTLIKETSYVTKLNDFSKSKFGKTLTITLVSVRIFLSSFLLAIINISNALMFRKRFRTRAVAKLRNRSKSCKQVLIL